MLRLNRIITYTVFLITLSVQASGAQSDSAWVSDTFHRGAFKLAEPRRVSDIVISADDFKVVQIAAENLAADLERVTGIKPAVRNDPNNLHDHVVFAGTLGQSSFIDLLVAQQKLDVTGLRGKWESFLITTVPNPVPGVSMGLVIAGSDRRGSAYGIFELSEAIGVSPWYWWADVTPRHRESL